MLDQDKQNIKSEYEKTASEVTYYVPLGKTYEVWNTKITNNDTKARNLSSFGFIEFTNEDNYEQDLVNLQYSLFITRTSFEGNHVLQKMSSEKSSPKSD